jgi:GT2 family glycosyltransferase
VAHAWSWSRATGTVQIGPGAAATLELALVQSVERPLTVEVAGLQLGSPGFRDKDGDREAEPVNLVENGDLLDWPRGLDIEAAGGRVETAAGWFVQNRRGAGAVRVRALTGREGVALAITGSGVGDYCRLEARLHPAARRVTSRLRLSFEAAVPTDAPRAFQGDWPAVVIERIFLLRRGRRQSDGASLLVSEAVAMLGRRITVGREPQRRRLDVDVDPNALSAGDLQDAELFVAFDLSRDFALTLRNLELLQQAEAPDAPQQLALEDPAVALQARTLKGLSGWLSPGLVEPGLRFAPEASEPAADMTWQWPATRQGSVEVVVCVHDAADDALACLTSLVGASSLPHTVRVIDDGSGEDTCRRLETFVAGKPWMRLVRNPTNLGYTASANIGVRGSGADWIVLLNSDTIVSPGWLEGLLECAASDPAIAFVGPVSNAASYQSVPELKDRSGSWKVNALPPGWTPRRMAGFVAEAADKGFPRVPLLNGFCMMMRREAFLTLGGLNEAAFPQGYGEENDLCVRAGQAGFGLAVADHVYVHHRKSASFGDSRRRELQKAAGQALARLHPDVDFTELGDRVREAAALVRLREKVRALHEAEG